MRYILSNDRTLRTETACCLCCKNIAPAASYARDLATRLIYCTQWRLEEHIAQSELSIEDAARRVS